MATAEITVRIRVEYQDRLFGLGGEPEFALARDIEDMFDELYGAVVVAEVIEVEDV